MTSFPCCLSASCCGINISGTISCNSIVLKVGLKGKQVKFIYNWIMSTFYHSTWSRRFILKK